MFDYIGVSYAGMAWLAWLALQQGDPMALSDQAVTDAACLAHKALDAWEKHGSPYSLQWMALWPLISVSLTCSKLAEAIGYARKICDPDQQAVDPALEEPMMAALAAWEADNRVEAQYFLEQTLETAKAMNYA